MFNYLRPLLSFAVIGLSCAAPAAAQTGLVIGQSLPLTGAQAAFGASVREGTQALVHMVNKAGGVNGKQLVIKVLDDEFKPDKTVANVKALAEADNALALVSMTGGPHVLAAMPVAQTLNLPVVGVLNGNGALRAKEGSTIVHVRVPFTRELDAIVKQHTTLGMKSFAVFAPDDAPGRAAAKGVVDGLAAHKLTAVADIAFARDAKDFTVYAKQVVAARPEVLVIFAPTKAAADLIGAFKSTLAGTKIVCVSVVDERGLFGFLQDRAAGVVFSSVVPNPYNLNREVTRQYQKAMKDSGAKQLSLASFEAFINAKVLVEGLRRAGANPTRASLRKALAEMPPTDLGDLLYRPAATATGPAGINIVDIVMLGRDGRLVR